MNVGGLSIELMANLARLASDLTNARGMLSTFAQNAQRTVDLVKGAFATLGLGLSVAALAALTNRTIDSIAKFKDLAQEAGTTAEAMSRFEEPTRKAGGSLDTVAAAMVRLSKAAIEARDPQSKSAQAFRAIGIEVERLRGLKPDEMFELVARQSAKYGDGIAKNAVTQELLSKSGREMSRVFAEIADTQKLAATVTNEQAEAADRFGDQLVELKMNSEAAWRSLAADGLPTLNRMIKAFIDGKREADLLRGAIGALSEFFSSAFGTGDGSAAERLAETNRQIQKAEEVAARVAKLRSSGLTSWMVSDEGAVQNQEKLNRLYAQRNALQREMFQDELAAQNKRALSGAVGKGDPRYDPEAQKRLQEAIENSKKYAAADAHVAQWMEHNIRLAKLRNDEVERELELDERARLAKVDAIKGVREYAERLEFETTIMGLSNAEREKAIALHTLEAAKLGVSAAELEKLANRVRDAVAAQDAMRTQMAVWSQLSDVVGSFFSDLVMNGKSAFDNLRRWVKQLLADMIALFAKRWVLNMAAGGSVWGSAAQAATGGIGSDSIAGSVLNWGSTAIGLTGAGGAASMFVGGLTGAIPSAAIGSGAVAAGVGIESGAAALGSSLSGVYSALAAIPVWGWIAMAVVAIGAWIAGNHKGGPKVGGSFFSGGAVPGTDNGRFFTPNQGDPMMRELVEATAAGYAQAVARLGGSAGNFNFGLGFDHDPQGTARSRVSSMVTDSAGRVLYSAMDREMDDKEVEGALALEAQRMLLVALQNSDLPAAVSAALNAVAAETATPEQIQAAIAAAQEIAGIIDVLALWDVEGLNIETLQAMVREGETLGQTFQSLAQSMATYYQAFYTEEENLARNTELLRKQFEAMGLEMPTSREAFRAMVEAALAMGEEGAATARWLLEVAGAMDAILPPLDAFNDQIEEVADTTAQAVQLFTAAIGQIVSGVNDPLTLYAQGKPARTAVGDYLAGLLSGDSSPLDPMQRFGAAEGEYKRVLGLAQGGDIEAIAKLPGVHKTMIDLARSIWGSSSPFVALFEKSFNELAGVAEVPDYQSRMLKIQEDALGYHAEQVHTLGEIRDLLVDIRDRPRETADSWSDR